MWCVASRPPRSSVVGFLEPDHPGRRPFAEAVAVERYEQSRDQFPHAEPFPASTLSAPPRSLCTVLTTTRQGYGSRVAFTMGVWSARLEEPCTAERVPETATGPTETPASCRSVAEVSFANGGFVARTRFGFSARPCPAMGPGHYGEVSRSSHLAYKESPFGVCAYYLMLATVVALYSAAGLTSPAPC